MVVPGVKPRLHLPEDTVLRTHIQGIFLSIFQHAVTAEVLKTVTGISLTSCLYNKADIVVISATRTTFRFLQGYPDHGRNLMQEFWTDGQASLDCW